MSFQKIIDTIADAFSVFDYSYIIAGGATFLILYADITCLHGVEINIESSFYKLVIGIFLSYVCGLVVWAIGRAVRSLFWDKDADFGTTYEKVKTSFSKTLRVPGVKDTTDKDISLKVTFSYIWSSLQMKTSNNELHEKIRLINRYWVMQAVFEGLIGTVVVAFLVGLDCYFTSFPKNIISECICFTSFPKNINFEKIIACKCILAVWFIYMSWYTLFVMFIILIVSCCFEAIYLVVLLLLSFSLIKVFSKEAQRYAHTQIIDVVTLYFIHFGESEHTTNEH